MIKIINLIMLLGLQHTWKHPYRRITGFGRREAGTSTLPAAPHRRKIPFFLLYLVTAPYQINVRKMHGPARPPGLFLNDYYRHSHPSQFALGVKVIITLLGWAHIFLQLSDLMPYELRRSTNEPETPEEFKDIGLQRGAGFSGSERSLNKIGQRDGKCS